MSNPQGSPIGVQLAAGTTGVSVSSLTHDSLTNPHQLSSLHPLSRPHALSRRILAWKSNVISKAHDMEEEDQPETFTGFGFRRLASASAGSSDQPMALTTDCDSNQLTEMLESIRVAAQGSLAAESVVSDDEAETNTEMGDADETARRGRRPSPDKGKVSFDRERTAGADEIEPEFGLMVDERRKSRKNLRSELRAKKASKLGVSHHGQSLHDFGDRKKMGSSRSLHSAQSSAGMGRTFSAKMQEKLTNFVSLFKEADSESLSGIFLLNPGALANQPGFKKNVTIPSNALWMIEGMNPVNGGPVVPSIGPNARPYRLKHIASNRYLAIHSDSVNDETSREVIYILSPDQLGEASLFNLEPMEASNAVEASRTFLRFSHWRMGYYFHFPKPPVSKEPATPMSGESIFGEHRDGKILRTLMMSDQPYYEDVFVISRPDSQQVVDLAFALYQVYIIYWYIRDCRDAHFGQLEAALPQVCTPMTAESLSSMHGSTRRGVVAGGVMLRVAKLRRVVTLRLLRRVVA